MLRSATAAAANITDASRSDLAVDFDDQPVISYSGTVFSELSGGEIDNTDPIEITISGDSFSGANGSDFVAVAKVTTNNVPPGLTLVLTKSSSTKLLATLTGTADAHADPGNDVSNLGVTFLDSAFTADADQVDGYSRGDLQVDFNNSTLTINTVPYNEAFEAYADGYQLGGSEGWQPGGAGTVTTETAIVSALVASLGRYPNTNVHSKVLCLSEETSDEIKSGTGGICFSDMMFYVTPREIVPTGSTNYQFAMFVDTNQLLNVWHRDTSAAPTNTWETLAGVTVSTSAWHRVTIEKDYAVQKYRLYLGGSLTPVDNPTSGDDWFNMVGTGNAYMSRLRVLGASATGPLYLDDLRVAETRPRYLIPNASTFLLR